MSTPSRRYVTNALRALAELTRQPLDPDIMRRARDLHDRLSQLPLEVVLEMVPGNSVAEKAARCGVTRQAFYNWMNGTLPQRKEAVQLAKVTGLTVAQIRGSSATTTAAARTTRVR